MLVASEKLSIWMHKCPFFPTGIAAVFAQFKIDQFRSIAWYNVAIGVALIILQLTIFHGESNCNKLPQRCTLCRTILKKRKISIVDIVISLCTVIELEWVQAVDCSVYYLFGRVTYQLEELFLDYMLPRTWDVTEVLHFN